MSMTCFQCGTNVEVRASLLLLCDECYKSWEKQQENEQVSILAENIESDSSISESGENYFNKRTFYKSNLRERISDFVSLFDDWITYILIVSILIPLIILCFLFSELKHAQITEESGMLKVSQKYTTNFFSDPFSDERASMFYKIGQSRDITGYVITWSYDSSLAEDLGMDLFVGLLSEKDYKYYKEHFGSGKRCGGSFLNGHVQRIFLLSDDKAFHTFSSKSALNRGVKLTLTGQTLTNDHFYIGEKRISGPVVKMGGNLMRPTKILAKDLIIYSRANRLGD